MVECNLLGINSLIFSYAFISRFGVAGVVRVRGSSEGSRGSGSSGSSGSSRSAAG